MRSKHYEDPIVYITCQHCGKQLTNKEVKVKTFTVDARERDLVIFNCPNCGKESESLVIG